MYVPFSELAPSSRVWIYQSNRPFGELEKKQIEDKLIAFTHRWAAHQKDLRASIKIAHNQFVILAVDESQHAASGCSIDSSVHIMKELENEFGLNFFDRSKVPFLVNNGLELMPTKELKEKIAQGQIKKDTPTFNNAVQNKSELDVKWLVNAEDSWMNRYFA